MSTTTTSGMLKVDQTSENEALQSRQQRRSFRAAAASIYYGIQLLQAHLDPKRPVRVVEEYLGVPHPNVGSDTSMRYNRSLESKEDSNDAHSQNKKPVSLLSMSEYPQELIEARKSAMENARGGMAQSPFMRHFVVIAKSHCTRGYAIIYKQEQAHDDSVWTCAWKKNTSNGTDNIITGSVDDKVKLWRWSGDRMELKHTLEGHQLGVVSVDINSYGTTAASSSLDSHIKLWDLDAGKQIRTFDAGPVDCWTLCFSPDNKYIATGSHTGKVNIFGIDSGKKESTLDTRGKFTMSVAHSPDGKYVACGAIDGIINIFDMTSGKLMHTLEGHAMPVRSLAFSPDSQLLVTASDDSHIKLYDVQNATLISNMTGHQSWVLNVDFSPDNQHFITSSSDKTVKVWEASSKSCIHTFYDHSDQVWAAKYNSTGSNITSVGDDKFVCVYECPI